MNDSNSIFDDAEFVSPRVDEISVITTGMGVDCHEPMFMLFRDTEEYMTCKEKFERVGWVPFLEKF